MLEYISEIKRQLISRFGLKEDPDRPGLLLDVPDGQYPMDINGKLDFVRVKDGKISCCNFAVSVGKLRQQTALQDANTPVVIVVKDEVLKKLLGNHRLVTVSAYPDTTDASGNWNSSFKIEIELAAHDK